jgi:hypothetical protein
MVKAIVLPLVRKQVVERADGRCECDIASHDHGADKCHRRPRHIVFKENAVRVRYPQADDLMAVCPSCRSQIQYERG